MNDANTVISTDVSIEGTITSKGNIQINGSLTGDLTCKETSEIGAGATIKGNIESASTTILGNVTGNISSNDKIEFKTGAKISGDIKSKRLTVEDGVTFTGHAEITPDTTSLPPKQAKSSENSDEESDEESDALSSNPDNGNKNGFFNRK
ncbi:MAG: polymer-forming cytoskeletal protein [Kiritimatiellae bacterium]|jgi:cytoskeletal protein CcmA (bactofilin family)|nr:polymer-forming cytoskeletal protein [Kiritimatiellia bacterium]